MSARYSVADDPAAIRIEVPAVLRPISPNITYVTHESDILKGNPLGDPHIRRFPVYLPPDYEESRDKRYPVIFGLMGFTGGGIMFLNRRFLTPGMDADLDDLIEGGMPGVIYVFPDCITSLGGSQYVNSTAVGRYQDYIVQELVPLIDSRYRTSGLRGCIGGSSGGIGSFTLAALYPDVFQAFADHSGDSAFDQCYLNDVPKVVRAMAKYNYDVASFVRQIPDIQPKDEDFNVILNMVAMSACYSPNLDAKQLGFELPFDVRTGKLFPEIWAKWLPHDPVNMVGPYAGNLRKLRYRFVDCGTKDQFHLYLGSRQLHEQLEAHNIDHIYEEYDSDHFLLRRQQELKTIPAMVATLREE